MKLSNINYTLNRSRILEKRRFKYFALFLFVISETFLISKLRAMDWDVPEDWDAPKSTINGGVVHSIDPLPIKPIETSIDPQPSESTQEVPWDCQGVGSLDSI